ncbi:MAG: glucose-6-phosphate dehydrogenase [Phycisphaerales bacterium]|jgi:glucose-6-phosphate 1-dehydrogenase|nr:glucose-6-phosphate dehydrogenase [Phycisphaerales bacterium]
MSDPLTTRKPEPFVMVVFGASGDLTRRKLIPAIFQLWCQNHLPESAAIIGYSRSEKTDESFRAELCDSIRDSLKCQQHIIDDAAWETFASRIFYQRGAYDSPEDFAALGQRIKTLNVERNVPGNCMHYLATPPTAFADIITNLNSAGLARKGQSDPWSRIVIEKPFGTDLQSALELNRIAREAFDEEQIFRIDHYLGKETVQNIMVLRLANSIFEHLWCHDYIDHIQITAAESLGVGSRGGYYDKSGALRDMVQNHLMHLLCLVAMEPPVTLTADAIRDEKVKVLRSLRPISQQCAANGVVRAQYTLGEIDGQETPGYLQADNVPEDSNTETFVAFKAHVDNWRWSGVPFYLRTGKALPRRCTEISIHFEPIPQILFNRPPAGPLRPNVLTIRVQPDEGIALEFQAKAPGPAMNIKPLEMDFGYRESFGQAPPEAYQRLLLDAAVGDATLFTRSDEVQAAWEFVTPVIEGCACEANNVLQYPAGSWGPKEADELIEADGKQWRLK